MAKPGFEPRNIEMEVGRFMTYTTPNIIYQKIIVHKSTHHGLSTKNNFTPLI